MNRARLQKATFEMRAEVTWLWRNQPEGLCLLRGLLCFADLFYLPDSAKRAKKQEIDRSGGDGARGPRILATPS